MTSIAFKMYWDYLCFIAMWLPELYFRRKCIACNSNLQNYISNDYSVKTLEFVFSVGYQKAGSHLIPVTMIRLHPFNLKDWRLGCFMEFQISST